MKLFYSPGSCSLGIHALLEEIGQPFELALVDLKSGAHFKAEYGAINPKATVPALQRDDGTILTEWQAIAWYLAKSNPALELLPADLEGEVRTLELLDYMVATVHMRGFSRIFRARNFTPTTADEPAVVQTGQDVVAHGFKLLDQILGPRAYLLGDFSIADAALFYLEHWAVALSLPVPPGLAGHYARLRQRPAFTRALATEGLV